MYKSRISTSKTPKETRVLSVLCNPNNISHVEVYYICPYYTI